MGNRDMAHQPLILPEYVAVQQDLIARGHGGTDNAGWVFETVDPDAPGAIFLKDGKPWYKTTCPHYEGFWLCGYIGSVQCKQVDGLIPSIHWQIFCRTEEGCAKCPYREASTGHASQTLSENNIKDFDD